MNILLAVSGSISCYKSYDLVRALTAEGHRVKVILTRGALKFIRPQTFRYLGAVAVYGHGDDFEYPQGEADGPVLHVELADWADRLAIAPLSANTASRLAEGKACDLLSSVFLAFSPEKTILIFPAMNSLMLEHPFTRENLQALEKLKTAGQVFIHPTDVGFLACETEGWGRLPSVEEVALLIETLGPIRRKKKVLISAGATLAPIDPARYVTNPSSGMTGYALAIEFLRAGYLVMAVVGRYATERFQLLKNHPRFRFSVVATTKEMLDCVSSEFDEAAIYASPAAISDLECKMSAKKIKKKDLDHRISFDKSPDILAQMIARKKGQILVGFAGETDLSDEVLREKFERKPVHLLVGTRIFHDTERTEGFRSEGASYKFFDGESFMCQDFSKKMLAQYIVEFVGRICDQNSQKGVTV